MNCAKAVGDLGLLADLVGTMLLAFPIIGQRKLYTLAQKLKAEKVEAGTAGGPANWDENDLSPTSEGIVRDMRLARVGIVMVMIGFLLQLIGSFLPN